MQSTRITTRRALAFVCLAVVIVASVEYRLLRILFVDRTALRAAFARSADTGWHPDYPDFLRGVAAHTANGDTIAVIVPPAKWDEGYAYAYYRASYFLAGREVLPVVTPKNAVVKDNFFRARFAAFWHVKPPANARVVWQGSGGWLVTR
jgi:hypothetical protein